MPLRRTFILTSTILASLQVTATMANPDILFDDFERPFFGNRWEATGDAFAQGPIAGGTIGEQRPVKGFLGNRCVNTYINGDEATGTLLSVPFQIERPYINFLIGGGWHEGGVGIDLLVDGEPVRRATGHAHGGGDSETLRWETWDVSGLVGETAQFLLYDDETGAWGHLLLDHIEQSERRRAARFPDSSVDLQMNVLLNAIPWAEEDDRRPVYHFHPPAFWLNDPNAPIFHDGWYHMFYQHNPYGDRWDHMHWGHARSRDMVTWEHLPIALAPSTDIGEVGVWSGSGVHDADGNVLLFYTSIHGHTSARHFAEQWVATPADDDLITWEKHPANPIMDLALHGGLDALEWRDPFFFKHEGETYCVIGGNIEKEDGFQGVVFLYRATQPDLLAWEYLGIVFEHPDPENENIEVPGLFRLDGKWVLTTTPPALNEYYIGELDLENVEFVVEKSGLLDASGNFFAPNSMETPDGRRVLWGWVRGFPADHGWNGVLTLPRVMEIGGDGDLEMRPLPELEALRTPLAQRESVVLEGTTWLEEMAGHTLEMRLTIDLRGAGRAGLLVRSDEEGEAGVPIFVTRDALMVDGVSAPLRSIDPDAPIDLRVYLDRSVIEVYANHRALITRVIDQPLDQQTILLRSEGGAAAFRDIQAWTLDPVFPGDAREELLRFSTDDDGPEGKSTSFLLR